MLNLVEQTHQFCHFMTVVAHRRLAVHKGQILMAPSQQQTDIFLDDPGLGLGLFEASLRKQRGAYPTHVGRYLQEYMNDVSDTLEVSFGNLILISFLSLLKDSWFILFSFAGVNSFFPLTILAAPQSL